jgi:hypothetical protein
VSSIELEGERLVALPKRFETATFNFAKANVGVIIQPNIATQTMNGCKIGCVQNSVQLNIAVLLQLS